LRLFENRVLKRIYGLKRKELTGEWRKVHNENLHYLDFLPNIRMNKSMKIRWADHDTCMWKMGNVNKIHQKPEGKGATLETYSRCRCEDNIKMNVKEICDVLTGFSWLRIGSSRRFF
jgi:hypothetical protein